LSESRGAPAVSFAPWGVLFHPVTHALADRIAQGAVGLRAGRLLGFEVPLGGFGIEQAS
jgi:hypothetical protein